MQKAIRTNSSVAENSKRSVFDLPENILSAHSARAVVNAIEIILVAEVADCAFVFSIAERSFGRCDYGFCAIVLMRLTEDDIVTVPCVAEAVIKLVVLPCGVFYRYTNCGAVFRTAKVININWCIAFNYNVFQ